MPKIHIHEDDEGMRNVYPATAVGEAMDDLATARSSSLANLAPNGVGWTQIHAIRKPERSFRELGIELHRVSDAVGNVLPRIKEFEVGFGENNPFHYREDDAHCFGFGKRLYLKLEADGDYLKEIWFDASSDVEEELAALRLALDAIDEIQPSMIADYWLNSGGLISDPEFADTYFEMLRSTAASSAYPATSTAMQNSMLKRWWARLMLRLFERP